MYLRYCYSLTLLIIQQANCVFQNEVVLISQGKVSGIRLQSRNGTPFWAYFGIPYAKPPVGKLRFQPPQEPRAWSGIRDSSKPTSKCLQWDKLLPGNEIIGQEDCLYLNVFTPNPEENTNIPVIVCIHSGAFLSGSSSECFPTYFMDKRVIMVSIEYRLGVFGFLSTGDATSVGNYGMKDQVAALRWVQKNIKQFGGDPDQVTIMGQSAGGASVHLHMFSTLSQGLFHRAISQSGSALAPWVVASQVLSRNRTNALGIMLGCSLVSSEILINCLRGLPAEELLKVYPRLYVWNSSPATLFTVTIEPDIKGAFLTNHPSELRELSDVPWMLGITSGEGGIVAAEYLSHGGTLVADFDKNYHRYMPLLFQYGFTAKQEDVTQITDSIKEYYFGNHNIGFMTAFQLRDMVTDGCIAQGSIKSALKYNNTRYFYYYDHLNERSFNEIWGDSVFMKYLGVSHGDDMISLFPMWMFPPLNLIDYRVSIRMIDYWTNFAYYGNPNGDISDEAEWKPVTSDQLEYLHIMTSSDVMEKKLLQDRFNFWETLPLLSQTEEDLQAYGIKIPDNVFEIYYSDTEEEHVRFDDEL